MQPDARQNNFDLLRLLAASQVVWQHASDHLQLRSPAAIEAILGAFPGVPIFFVISGFLISLSYERAARDRAPRQYAINRFLRIYPGLWVAFAVGISIVAAFGALPALHFRQVIPWILAQLTFVQYDNPGFLRHFGTGVLNGSLWTIPVELEFYALLPVLYGILSLRERGTGRLRLLGVLIALALVNVAFTALGPAHEHALWYKAFKVTVIPYLYMFLVGVALQRNMDLLRPFLAGKAAWWLAAYAVACALGVRAGVTVGYNDPFPLLMALLGVLTVSCAFTAGNLAQRLLRGNDISYGVYVYHMLVINALIASGRLLGLPATLVTYALSYTAALLSWTFVERPALRLKAQTIRVVGAAPARSV